MTTKPQHSPLPWKIVRRRIVDANNEGLLVTGVSLPCGNNPRINEAEANDALIVTAVNCHDDLLEVAKRIVEWMDANGYSPDDQSFGARAAIAKTGVES